MYFDDSFPDKSSGKEGLERDSEVSTGDACQIKQRVGNRRTGQNSPEAIFLHIVVNDNFCYFHEGLLLFPLQLKDFLNLLVGQVMLFLLFFNHLLLFVINFMRVTLGCIAHSFELSSGLRGLSLKRTTL